MPNTIRLHRLLRASPEMVYRAFLDADALAKWLPPNGFTGKVHHPDFERRYNKRRIALRVITDTARRNAAQGQERLLSD